MDCKICHERPVYRKKTGMCQACTKKKRRRERVLLCRRTDCTNKREQGRTTCRSCRGERKRNPPKVGVCGECHEEGHLLAKDMCPRCYRSHRRHSVGSGEWNKKQKHRAGVVAENNTTEKDFGDLLGDVKGKNG